ncbi:hypothetical protein [Neobacillus ginsengisoli]|uniref:Glutathione synthase/RimK-type ligase-like ATP-grasp enzyme n=1 Tax=Neobacillus ginsengisoli TaxID=904295 RepID=A0ABT9Y0H8_9BACI|nr:hypothetical protein [Neobacillus ginsengisoli]MDQ0201337.1 glutathione synthase/RimK-type ligase-like ATP-grasp enzyme [Neobacillus ginsengisoli]
MTFYSDDRDHGIDVSRKSATNKTSLINKGFYQQMNWEKLKTEQKLASQNIVVHVPLPVIYRKPNCYNFNSVCHNLILLKSLIVPYKSTKSWSVY